ncbi:uncharacterized protein LOC108824758 [Raphanus sativus]|uniref:Uncharacterized protein LOC108824758 n=1 Tax=Raphanus sativus TaxID=3726 RepID=A0A6J0L1W5_RAPSA|nr:uncharacterized protein LOC108824758 [Raphanus sativus]
MIDFVLEFVNKTASNSSFMFLFFDFIIILILLGNTKPGSEDKSNSGAKQPRLISDSVLSSKSVFKKSEPSLTSKSHSQESGLMSKSFLSSKHTGSNQSLTCKPGLRIISYGLQHGSDFSEKDEKGTNSKTENLEVGNEMEVECLLQKELKSSFVKLILNGK